MNGLAWGGGSCDPVFSVKLLRKRVSALIFESDNDVIWVSVEFCCCPFVHHVAKLVAKGTKFSKRTCSALERRIF